MLPQPPDQMSLWPFLRKGPSGYSYFSTAEQVTRGVDASGLTAIVTGSTNGIGVETARVLVLRGARVIMAVRNTLLGRSVRERILKELPDAEIQVLELDLSSMASVRNFAFKFESLNIPLNILINNAGISSTPFALSRDGIEMQFATNHLGHFLLTNLLLDNMKDTARRSGIQGRIINVSSDLHLRPYREGIRFEKMNDEAGYRRCRAYGQSKLANILHSNELARRLKEEGANVTASAVHPGCIPTNIVGHDCLFMVLFNGLAAMIGKNVHQGAATSCYAALHPKLEGVSGKYLVDCNFTKPGRRARDKELAKKLWEFSMKLTSD